MKKVPSIIFFFLMLPLLVSGCGYTQKTVLPRDARTIYVDTVKNAINLGELYAYHPGLEMMITQAITRRVNQDGNLRVAPKDEADVILESKLTRFEQGGLRFTSLERVEEYRLFVVMAVRLVDRKTGDVIWEEPEFSGDAEYFVSGVRSMARAEAAERAVNRLARNVVDRVVEDW